MYNPFFRLISNPFSNTIPPDNYSYLPFNHRVILQTLINDLYKSRGLLLLIGASGVGKSTLLNTFLGDYDENSNIVFRDLSLQKYPQALESDPTEIVLKYFSDESSAERDNKTPLVFFLDSTENLTHSFLKILLDKVSECNRNNKPVLLILTGQPQFEAEIKRLLSELSIPLAIKSFFLRPLENRQVKNYIKHHLISAGRPSGHLFSDEAIQLITQLSKGIPRAINTLCSLSLSEASLKESRVIDEEIVNHASEFLPPAKNTPDRKEALIPVALDAIQTQPLDSDADKHPNQIKIVPPTRSIIRADELAKEKTKDLGLNAINKKPRNKNKKTSEPTQVKEQHLNVLPIAKKRSPPISKNPPEAASDLLPSGEQTQSKVISLLNAPADKAVSKDAIYTPALKSIFLKVIKQLSPLILFFAFLIWINPQNIKPAKNLAKTHPDIIKPPPSTNFTALLAENKIERNRYQEVDGIIERLRNSSNKSIAFSRFNREFQQLHTEQQIKNTEQTEEHLLAKLKKQPLLQKPDASSLQEIKETVIPEKILVTKETIPKNQIPIPYRPLPKDAGYSAGSDDTEFLKHFFGGTIPIGNNRQLPYEAELITATVLNSLNIIHLSKGQLTLRFQDSQANSASKD